MDPHFFYGLYNTQVCSPVHIRGSMPHALKYATHIKICTIPCTATKRMFTLSGVQNNFRELWRVVRSAFGALYDPRQSPHQSINSRSTTLFLPRFLSVNRFFCQSVLQSIHLLVALLDKCLFWKSLLFGKAWLARRISDRKMEKECSMSSSWMETAFVVQRTLWRWTLDRWASAFSSSLDLCI